MNNQTSVPLSPPSEIGSFVGDLNRLCPLTFDMSAEQLRDECKKRQELIKARFPNPDDRDEASRLIAAIDADRERRQLQAILDSVDPKRLWMPVASDGVLSGFLPGEVLSTGGTSEIRECLTRFARYTVVVKVINRIDAKHRLDKLLAIHEHQTLLKLNHPNIVKVYDAGYLRIIEESGAETHFPYIAMERLKGVTLASYVSKNIPKDDQSSAAWTEWYVSMAKANAVLGRTLAHCHQLNIVHGDFKPDNVHVCGIHPAPENLKVYDFGFSATEDLDVPGNTPRYSDPAAGNGNDQPKIARDIFSLGATMLYCATGRGPPNWNQSVDRKIELVKALENIKDDTLGQVIAKAMSFDRDGRYSSASQLAEDLDAWATDHPLPHLGRSYSTLERELLLIKRCRNGKSDIDHLRLLSRASFVIGTLCFAAFVAQALMGFSGYHPLKTTRMVGDTLTVLTVMVASLALYLGRRLSYSVAICEPFIALVLALALNVFVLLPVNIGTPSAAEMAAALKTDLLVVGVAHIFTVYSIGSARAWRLVAWAMLAVVVLLRSIAGSTFELPVVAALFWLFESLATFSFGAQLVGRALREAK